MRASSPQIRYPSRPVGPSPLRPRTPSGFLALALASVLAFALLAGCTAGGGDSNKAPHAVLEVNKDNGYTGEEFTFDASKSTDDGEELTYRFDFGDDTPPMEVSSEDADEVTHAYIDGGQYTVTLTVLDAGKDNTGSRSDDDAVNIIVNERIPIASTSVNAIGTNTTGEHPFDVHEDANRFDLNLTLRSALVTGSSEFEVKVVDPDNETIATKTTPVGPGTQGTTVTLDGLLTKQGNHSVVIVAKTGGGTAEGELRVIYGEDLPA
ncbi:MAG TPA: PKD domain-containing protein [Candidatus Thermoplasmatota archaeon]|nr:PKD domain-containing protein [Candidatus Thermoplasmatota archaeon]